MSATKNQQKAPRSCCWIRSGPVAVFPRMQRERAEMEQNFAREIGNLVQRLSSEKDQLEAELKLKMDQEVSLLR